MMPSPLDSKTKSPEKTMNLNGPALHSSRPCPQSTPEPTTEDVNDFLKNRVDSVLSTIPVLTFLKIAKDLRGGEHHCEFREQYQAGAYNLILFIVFDDGIEWVVKLPVTTRTGREDDDEAYLVSECATLKAFERRKELNEVPVPRVIACKFNRKNEMQTAYLIMTKVPGTTLAERLFDGTLGEEGFSNVLTDLASIKKTLLRTPFNIVGSYTSDSESNLSGEQGPVLGKHLSLWNWKDWIKESFGDGRAFGPYSSSTEYYASVLNTWWKDVRSTQDHFELNSKLYSFLVSLIVDLVKISETEEKEKFFLTHTDLHMGNIFVDEQGHITGIIDWEFASTLPRCAGDQYPLFLASPKYFALDGKVTETTEKELLKLRAMYESHFDKGDEMQPLFANLDMLVAFQKILRESRRLDSTLHKLQHFGFIGSAADLDQASVLSAWKSPRGKRERVLTAVPRPCSAVHSAANSSLVKHFDEHGSPG